MEVIGPIGCDERGQKPKGNPVRKSFESCRPFDYEEGDTLKVLVSGGSGGAQTLDQRLPEVLNKLHESIPLEVTHISRRDAGDVNYSMKATVRPPGPDFLQLLDDAAVEVLFPFFDGFHHPPIRDFD